MFILLNFKIDLNNYNKSILYQTEIFNVINV